MGKQQGRLKDDMLPKQTSRNISIPNYSTCVETETEEDGQEASPGILQTSFDVFLQCAQCKHTFPSCHPQTL